jgi:hypothetical protein
VVENGLHSQRAVFSVHLVGERLGELHRLYELGEILDRNDGGDGSTDVRIRLGDKSLPAFLAAFPEAQPDRLTPPVANSA